MLEGTSLEVFGSYGLEGDSAIASPARRARQDVQRVAGAVAGAWVEDKGPSIAVHYRSSPRPEQAHERLRRELDEIARRHALVLLEGKMVLELAPPETPGKGHVVARETRARRLVGCLYAGDDIADRDAFDALDRLRSEGVATLKVAVSGAETPDDLVGVADLVVEGPSGLVALLRGFLDR